MKKTEAMFKLVEAQQGSGKTRREFAESKVSARARCTCSGEYGATIFFPNLHRGNFLNLDQ